MKNNSMEQGETLFKILLRGKYRRLTKGKSFIEREGITNGNGIAHIFDGGGKRVLTHAFAGSIIDLPQNYSDTVEYSPKPEWSNGSDTKSIEARLRATKKKLSYVEVTTHGGKRKGAGRPKQ